MKRFAAILMLFSIVSYVALPLTAEAGQWRQNEIKWHRTSVGSPTNATGIYVRDTTYTVVAASVLDTTGTFSATPAGVWPGNGVGTASADTSIVGFLVIQSDTTAAISSAVTSVTYEIDGRQGGFGVATDNAEGWTQVDSSVVNCVADAAFGGTIALPIRAIADNFLTTGTLGATTGNRYFRIMAYNDLRCRITATTGVMGAARVWWRWWSDN
jgi:hypothetical protein